MFDDWRPRAIVFDCDGLLVDTEGCWTLAETELFRARGLTFAAADKEALIGVAVPAACAFLAELFDDGSSAEQIERELLIRVAEIVGEEGRAMAGAVELMALALERLPTAVASNSPRALLDQALAVGGFAGLPAVTVAADEVRRPKPAPDLYLTACARLGVDPPEALAVEDSAPGIRAASAAGMRTVGVPTLRGVDIGAERTLSSLADPQLLALLDPAG
ncbi:MAG TPA: HAD family phosphatase [Solirubrobacteraceae bacterium]|nr:HAD family phosphatase [Solirubrobacteraceae bacterium]